MSRLLTQQTSRVQTTGGLDLVHAQTHLDLGLVQAQMHLVHAQAIPGPHF